MKSGDRTILIKKQEINIGTVENTPLLKHSLQEYHYYNVQNIYLSVI